MKGQVDTSCEEFCLNTWKYWTKKNNVDLIVFNDPIEDVNHMKPTWQRWYVWELLKENNLEYDKVALVDVDTMISWDRPNFFDLITDEIGVCSDNDNIGWVQQSIYGYKEYFHNVNLDWTDYFNCGFIIMNKSHSNLCGKIINFWLENQENLRILQDTLRKGTDQTPVNYIVKKDKTDIIYLNKKYNLTQLNRKEILQDFTFIDCGYIWHFNGFDKNWREPLMRDTWNKIKINYEN